MSVTGVIEYFTASPTGDIDGLMLNEGTIVHWPSLLGQRFREIVEQGDRVKATGVSATGPNGNPVLEIRKLENLTSGKSREIDERNPVPDSRAGMSSETVEREMEERNPVADSRAGIDSKTLRGVARKFTMAARGEVNGLVLSDGTFLHWPPHMGDRFASQIEIGRMVTATGRMMNSPAGSPVMEVDEISGVRSERPEPTMETPPPREDRPDEVDARDFATVRGTVKELTKAPEGEVNGLILRGGTILHWPADLGLHFRESVEPGARIEASGNLDRGPRGERVLEVTSLSSLEPGTAIRTNDQPADHPLEARLRAVEERLDKLARELERRGP